MLRTIAPRYFLCKYQLRTGAIAASVVLILVTLICLIAMIVQVLMMRNCMACSWYAWTNSYSFSISGVIYCFLMLFMHGWLIWGIKKNKSSVLLSWVVVTGTWLLLTFFLMITLICLHTVNINFIAWILCLVLGLIAIVILTYFLLVVFGLWYELKDTQRTPSISRQNNN